jgi:DnaK suppressor protein
LERGEFGYCVECGNEIGAGRLDADPAAHLCITCASARSH